MSNTEERCRFEAPHPDIEHGIARRPIEYLLTRPEQGIARDTGLIFLIDGYGMTPADPYNTVLRQYIASRYNLLAVGVFYFGNRLKSADFGRTVPGPDFFVNLAAHHGISVSAPPGLDMDVLVKQLCGILAGRGVERLDRSCWFYRSCDEEYDSFGLLPALDHLQVLGALLQRFTLDRSRLFVLGSSMGGYIAQLLTKLAPHTFRMIIDNSGPVESQDLRPDKEAFRRGWLMGVEVRAIEQSPWQADPAAPHGFAEHHRLIRDLRVTGHMRRSRTFHRMYHSVLDGLVPLADRVDLAEKRAAFAPTSLECIDDSRLDGMMFKTLEHGMKASLLHLLDDGWRAMTGRGPDGSGGPTDFCRESHHRFECGGFGYEIAFSRNGEVRAGLGPTRL